MINTNTFTIRLSDETIEINPIYQEVKDYCRDFIYDGVPDFVVQITQNDIDYERKRSAQAIEQGSKKGITFPDSYLEELAVYRKIAEWMPSRNTFLFHGSAIAVDGCAYLFTAASGTGKSTHARLWREMLGDRAVMVNDDKPLIRVPEQLATGTAASPIIYGTPWNGKHRLGSNIAVPLKAICILERAADNHICEITGQEVLPMLLQQVYRPADPTALAKTLTLIDRLTKQVRFYRLSCNMEPEAAMVSFRAMHDEA